MATYRLGVLYGDGIGSEVVPAAVAVAAAALDAAGVEVEWTPLPMGLSAITEYGSALPEFAIETLAHLDGWILGPHDSVSYPEEHRKLLNPSGLLRKKFDLFANVRPAKSFPGVPAVVAGVDLVIVRENTEGFYSDRNTFAGTGEFMPVPDVAITMGVFTRKAIERVAHVAFGLAVQRGRRVTIVHKANVLKATAFFRDICREVGAGYPDVAIDDFHVDAMAAHLVRHPERFDVIVTENMFGDILSDLTGELAGSLGLASSINASATVAMAQAAHGSAPDIAGKDVANPIAMILSTAMLLEWLGGKTGDSVIAGAARTIAGAVEATLAAGIATPDLGGTSGTRAFAAAVAARVSGGS